LPRRDAADIDEGPQVFLAEEEFVLIADAMFPSDPLTLVVAEGCACNGRTESQALQRIGTSSR
jgi:hypothetical protein